MDPSGIPASTSSRSGVRGAVREGLAGFVGAVVLITNIVSFAALMFPGALAAGAATAVWAMLIGSGVVGLWVAWKTTLPPLATGIDSPTGQAHRLSLSPNASNWSKMSWSTGLNGTAAVSKTTSAPAPSILAIAVVPFARISPA